MAETSGLSICQAALKRGFDFSGAALGLAFTLWIILPAWVLATLGTRENGFFTQKRVGRNGQIFWVIKIRTMRNLPGMNTTVTTGADRRVTALGRFWRKTKIDELPQLINVLKGDMSFVGPRPDVPGYADKLEDEDRIILSVRPGITGPATLKYRDEEKLLTGQKNPERYNNEVIWPDKVRINKEYIKSYSFKNDLVYIAKTIFG